MLVEAHGLRVLLVDGELAHAEVLDAVLEELSAEALAACPRVEEEHLQTAALHAHEAHGRGVPLGHDERLNVRERLRNERLDLGDLGLGEKRVRGAHGALPHAGELVDELGSALGDDVIAVPETSHSLKAGLTQGLVEHDGRGVGEVERADAVVLRVHEVAADVLGEKRGVVVLLAGAPA